MKGSSLAAPVWLTTKTLPSGSVTASGWARPRTISGPSVHVPVSVSNCFVLENGCSSSLSPPMTMPDPSDIATVAGCMRSLFRLGTSAHASEVGSYSSAVSLPGSGGPGMQS